jgi:probable phosphoglycerate mutase
MSACTLIFVRHGVTDWNRLRRFQGQTDIALNADGLDQAERTAAVLGTEKVAAVYSSDLLRTRQTAEPIARALGMPLVVEPGLRERSYGLLEGRTHDELRRDHPEVYQRWRAREPDFVPSGGESLRALHVRVERQIRLLAQKHAHQTVVAVTHGGVLDCIYRIAAGMPIEAPRSVELRNASLNRVFWNGQSFSVLSWGEVDHLQPSRDDIEP